MKQKQKAESRKQKCCAARMLAVSFCFLLSAFCFPLNARNGAYRQTKHGDPVNGPLRNVSQARGSCVQCHDGHAGQDRLAASDDHAALFAPNDNDFCFTCHTMPSRAGVFPGSGQWLQSSHARSGSVYRPGINGRSSADANKCVNCHDPHGVKDANGVIPAMLVMRDADLCLACHDGSRTTDLARDLTKPYRHPIGPTGRHQTDEDKPASFGSMPVNNRHAECSDCHNVHRLGADPAPPLPPQASNRLAGVSRVHAAYGGAGAAPTYTFAGADDPVAGAEFEVCFKCHSSFTTQPPGQSNLALLTNPANPSFHPIQGEGKNARIDPQAFTGNFTAESIISCTDCHSSDDPRLRGPHASSYRYLLKKPSTTTTFATPMSQNDICFDCHSYGVYGDAGSPSSVVKASRFNAPGGQGHTFHVGAQHIPCYGCHETHGSTRHAALIARRLPGITSYIQTSPGGTCTATCHTARTYTVNYPR